MNNTVQIPHDLVAAHPFLAAYFTSLIRPCPRPLTPAQTKTFLAQVEGHPMEAFYVVALSIGLLYETENGSAKTLLF